MAAIPKVMTVDDLTGFIESHVDSLSEVYASNGSNGSNGAKAIRDVVQGFVPAWVKVEVIEEDDDTLLVREIMEESCDEVRFRVTLDKPIEYISVTIKV